MKNRKVPLRKCIATQEMKAKRELIRIVRSKDGEVSIDPTGKMSGRGAYISKDKQCILDAKKKNVLAHHLGVKVDESIYDEILQFIEKEQR